MKQKGLLIGYFLLISGAISWILFDWAYDDPFITYRYAENISRGLGFVYNPGERVLSTTTPLFTLLLAVLRPFWPDLPHLANVIGALSLAAGALMLWGLARLAESPLTGWLVLLLYPAFPLLGSTIGSETPLYLALITSAIVFYLRKAYPLAGMAVALATLARPDGILIGVILAGDYLLREILLPLRSADRDSASPGDVWKRLPWKAIAVFLLPLLGWALFAWLYFGSPVPVTLAVKQYQGSLPVSLRFAQGFVHKVVIPYGNFYPYPLMAVLLLPGLIFAIWKRRRWLLLIGWTLLYFIAYTVLNVSSYYWYYAPLVPAFVVLFALGIEFLVWILASLRSRVGQARYNRTGYVLVIILLALVFPWQVQDFWELSRAPDSRNEIYQAAGEWLRDNTEPDALVGLLDTGIIGYYARRPVIDFAGLIRPQVARQLSSRSAYEDAAIWAVQQYHPRYLVLQSSHFPRLEELYALPHCSTVERLSGKQYGYSADMLIYACP